MLRMLGSLASCLFGCYGLEPSWITYEFENFFSRPFGEMTSSSGGVEMFIKVEDVHIHLIRL